MNATSINVFPIEGIDQYSAKYRLFAVRGLSPDDDDFHRNLNALAQKVARELRAPVMSVIRDKPYLVIREGANDPKASHQLVRSTAVLEKGHEVFTLDFAALTTETRPIGLRFLQFALQGAFWKHQDLWQPATGGTFFERKTANIGRTIGLHKGFLVRVVDLSGDGFGLCIDARHKYVGLQPLPKFISRKHFADRYKGCNVIYHYGHEWYQIRLEEINDLTATEFQISENGQIRSLLEYVQVKSEKPLPPELAHLAKDCSVVHYFNSRDQKMAAPSALCFPSYLTSDYEVRKEHRRTLLSPEDRRHLMHGFRDKYLDHLRLDGKVFKVSQKTVAAPGRIFAVPDLLFRNQVVLSANDRSGAVNTDLQNLGSKKLDLLKSKRVGFFTNSPLQKQYFFVPHSIWQSWGPRLLEDLKAHVDELYVQEHGYEPELVSYNDSKGPTWVDQATAIVSAARDNGCRGGFAVVMLIDTRPRHERKEEELAAYVLRKLYDDFDIRAAVMHTDTGAKAYQLAKDESGRRVYVPSREMRGRLDGYLRNVALNKVLLTNEKWPFVLANPMHADVTIGIDLKHNHVGFTLVGRGGQHIDTLIHKTRFREMLRAEELAKYLFEIVKRYHDATGEYANTFVIHRDGRLFESEIKGAKDAFTRLRDEGFVSPTATLTSVEIGKHSFTSLRLFTLQTKHGGEITENPTVGQHFIASESDGYLVATGKPFARQGTALPLHVRKVEGPLSVTEILEDVFWLTNLNWSQPEGCTRHPITIKINDRRLSEDAGQFDENEMEIHEEGVES